MTSKQRSQALPQVPTMAEAGYADIEGDSWVGFLAPTGTANDIIAFLNRQIMTAIDLPEIRDRLVTLGYDPKASTPEAFAAQIKNDVVTWTKIIRAANIKLQ